MKRTCRFDRLAGVVLAAAALLTSGSARAQTADTSGGEPTVGDAISIGDWSLRPSLQYRARLEGRRYPVETGAYWPAGAELTGRRRPVVGSGVDSQWFVHQRARLGMALERGMFRGVVQLQDARVWGQISPAGADRRDQVPSTSAHLAYAELRDSSAHPTFLRVGRQEIQWGEGRLLGRSDWSPTGRSLDAARGVLVLGKFDLEGFASVLSPPGGLPASVSRTRGSDAESAARSNAEGAGAQLHGVRIAWHLAPLLHIELNGLARFVRLPAPAQMIPSDLYVAGARVSGSHQWLAYSLEGAYEAGRIATSRTAAGAVSSTSTTDIQAYAGAARLELATGLFWKLKVGGQGSYASGQTASRDKVTRFDPILPDVYTAHGPMGMYAWSNIIEGAGYLKLVPMRESQLLLGYRHVALARPSDDWHTSDLVYVGRDPNNTSRTLGNELDVVFGYSPWAPLNVSAGYGLFLLGQGGKEIVKAMGRGNSGGDSSTLDDPLSVQHWGFVQLTMTAP
jgi:hypothetical protein